ncbi:MAG: hypothetical protein WDN44_09125 [Sphingomonas sp.]
MAYWFPKKSRVNELSRLLAGYEAVARLQLSNVGEHIPHLSAKLEEAQRHSDFPKAQIPRWLWLASQYRLNATTDAVIAARAAAALQILSSTVEKTRLGTDDIQVLNWILEATVAALAPLVGSADLRGCLSEAELGEIDSYLARFEDVEPFDREAIVRSIEPQLHLLASFGGVGDLTSIQAKIAALLDAAERPGDEYKPARAALRYLADEDDVVSDRTGVIGLVDDIYVIEWAYAAVESQTRCLPLLEAMLRRWPFVGTAGLAASGTDLNRYAQYVCCAALFTLFGPTSGALVLRENGAFPIVAAVAAGLEAARLQADNFAEELTLWKCGDPITISDGTTSFHAVFDGVTSVGAHTRCKIRVGDSGSITVGDEVLPYLSRSGRVYKRLSRGQDILLWLKDRNVDSLTHLTGTGRRRPERHETILLVGPRWKLDEYLDLITPLDTTPSALLGARWIDSRGDSTDLRGSATDRPLIYACADAATACELVADPPAHISCWRIIVDGARLGRNLHAILSTTDRLDKASVCIFAELHDREATAGLHEQGLRGLWYLEDQDVLVPPSMHFSGDATGNLLTRFLARQSNHWTAGQSFHAETDEFLEAVAECLESHAGVSRDDPALQALDLSVATFLRRAIGIPLAHDTSVDDDPTRLTRSIMAQASMLSAYDEGARRLRDLFGQFLASGVKPLDRRAPLERIASEAPSSERMAVVCRSARIAGRCRDQSRSDPTLARYDWMTLETLRRSAPYDRVVIPGWVDRETMREVGANGYGATTDIILLPFERRWYDKTRNAARRWERRLEHDTARILKDISETEFALPPARWREQLQLRHDTSAPPQDTQGIDDETPTEHIEARALEALVAALPKAAAYQQQVKAQLVLFEEPGTYALLPPNGQIIVLRTEGTGQVSTIKPGGGEKQLFVNVSALQPGMLLALPETTDRDLIDARADQLLVDAGSVRAAADRWKHALKRHFDAGLDTYSSFSLRMSEAGQSRDAFTIRSWANDTRSIAPRNYRTVVPLLARLTEDAELIEDGDATISAIDQIYRARARAAELLIGQIFSGELDLSGPQLEIAVSGRRLTFGLHKVERCAGVREVPIDLLGRARNFTEMPTQALGG